MPPIQWVLEPFSPDKGGFILKLITHNHPVQSFRMCGVTAPGLFPYTGKLWPNLLKETGLQAVDSVYMVQNGGYNNGHLAWY